MSEEISLLMKSSNWVARRAEMRGGVNQLRDPHYRNIRPLRNTQKPAKKRLGSWFNRPARIKK